MIHFHVNVAPLTQSENRLFTVVSLSLNVLCGKESQNNLSICLPRIDAQTRSTELLSLNDAVQFSLNKSLPALSHFEQGLKIGLTFYMKEKRCETLLMTETHTQRAVVRGTNT